jgi:DNA replication protein DnaD
MDNEKIYTTSLRLYKKRPIHAQAYRCLKNYNTDIFKTKDDFIAEAVIYFARYLKQEEEAQKMELLNAHLESQKEQFIELIKEAVLQVQTEGLSDMIEETVFRSLENRQQDTLAKMESDKEQKIQGDSFEKDILFAQFYDEFED